MDKEFLWNIGWSKIGPSTNGNHKEFKSVGPNPGTSLRPESHGAVLPCHINQQSVGVKPSGRRLSYFELLNPVEDPYTYEAVRE